MVTVSSANALDVEALINRVASDMSQGAIEDNKATGAIVRAETSVIRSKRQERIDNLVEQMRGMATGGGACYKFTRFLFKVVDFLAKPLSALTLNKLKVDLTKILETLKEQKGEQGLTRLKIRGDEILKTIQEFKSLLGDDTETLRKDEEQNAKETRRVMEILEDLHETYLTTTRG